MDGYYLPLVDLLVQLSTLKNPSTGSPYLSASQDTWASLISNYFEYCKNNKEVKNDETNLKWATVRDYFLENNRVNLMKSKNRHKFFHIKESDRVYN